MLLGKLKVSGHSMQPYIQEDDEVLVSSIPFIFLKPKIGDIVAFLHLNKFLIKRIKQVKKSQYLLEGDNISDSLKIGWITKKDIIGKVIYKI